MHFEVHRTFSKTKSIINGSNRLDGPNPNLFRFWSIKKNEAAIAAKGKRNLTWEAERVRGQLSPAGSCTPLPPVRTHSLWNLSSVMTKFCYCENLSPFHNAVFNIVMYCYECRRGEWALWSQRRWFCCWVWHGGCTGLCLCAWGGDIFTKILLVLWGWHFRSDACSAPQVN